MKSIKIVKVSDIVAFLGDELLACYGDVTNTVVDNISDPDNTVESTLDLKNKT